MRMRLTVVLFTTLCMPVLLHARVEGHFDRTLTVSGPVSLDLTTGSGEIAIKSGSTNQVVIHGTVRSSNEWFSSSEGAVHQVESNPPIQQNGSSIRIGYDLPEDVKRHVSISYEVTVPADTKVQAHSGSGTIGVNGVRSGVEATTGSGDVRLRDIGSGVRAQTGSGEIQAQLTGSGDSDVQTGSGSVRLTGVKGGLRARTGSGDIEADGDVKGPWQLNTGSGSVHVAVGSGSGFNLDVHTSSGSIHSDLPITVQGSLGRRELKGTVRGGGPDLEVSTGSGDVTIR